MTEVHTHAWFDRPAEDALKELRDVMSELMLDKGASGDVQAIRMPGVLREDTGNLQQLFYLAPAKQEGAV